MGLTVSLVAGALLTSLLACATSTQGVVRSSDTLLELVTPEGRVHPLVLGVESEPVRYLDACTVKVEGRRVGARIAVGDWSVVSAADGSAPYVGKLRLLGSQLMVDDRNSGSTFVLEARSGQALRPYVDEPVLVIGFVVAPNVIQVMGWRVLSEAAPPG